MASGTALPEPPAPLKAIQSYMRIAQDIDRVDPVVAYWARLYSTETALKIDRETPECKIFLTALISWLEKFKSSHKDNEAVTNQTVGQAHMENFVVALFNKADTLDREGTANKNTVRMFYMAAVLFEAMAVFGPLEEEVTKKAKYAKFKAAYIQKCLKTGQTPKPGPIEGSDLEMGPQDNSSQPPGSQSDANSSTTHGQSSGGLDIPEVPTDSSADKDTSFNTKPDPYIMTPQSPPVKPALPPNTRPIVGYPDPSSSPAAPKYSTPMVPSNTVKSTINATKFTATNGAPLNAEDLIKTQKYCKFANSALQYDDIPTAVANLEKALKLLKTGQDSE